MGLIVSVLFSYVGAVELVFMIRDVVHQIGLHQRRLQQSKEDLDDGLQRMQDALRKSISVARRHESENIQCMEDGVQYENGYRVDNITEDWIQVRKAIERGQQDTMIGVNSIDRRRSVESGGSRASLSPDQSSNSQSNASTNTVIENDLKASSTSKVQTDRSNRSSSPEVSDMHFDAYSESYLRSLDGIKMRPLVRDDGNRRHRAFKKGQSGSSNSSNISSSREEELKMFTSLEEEEFEAIRNSDYKPLQYSSEPNLKANQHSRRHKRSPVQDLNRRSSDIIDEIPDPWGDVKPEHFHDTELWKKERTLSIAEADDDLTNGTDGRRNPNSNKNDAETSQMPDFDRCYSPVGKKYTKMSSFEEASGADHTRAINILRAQTSNEDVAPAVNEKVKPHPNVSISADLPINQIAIDNASANANALNEMESFACKPALPAIPLTNTANIRVEVVDADYSTSNDLKTIISDDDKIEEFMSYIQKLDRKQSGDKLDFKEYLDQSNRLRYPSYNYDAREIEELTVNVEIDNEIVEAFEDDEDQDRNGNASQSFLDGERDFEIKSRRVERDYDLALRQRQEKIDKLNSTLNPYAKSFDYKNKSSKSEVFENLTTLEQGAEHIDHPEFQTSFNVEDDIKERERDSIRRVKKIDDLRTMVDNSSFDSKRLNPSNSELSINEIDFVFVESTDLNDEPQSCFEDLSSKRAHTDDKLYVKPPMRSVSYAGGIIDSSSLENINVRKESLVSNQSSESSEARKTSKLPYNRSSSSMSYAREDSWISIDSNTIGGYQRSPSRTSELEYIKGRDDWRDVSSYHVRHEIDSDDYHHYRRYSETADTLEYIRGRDDWMRHEENRERCSTLPRIYEGNGRIGINEEIDADEYHHHRCLSEIISYANEASNTLFLAQGSARSGRERSPYKVLRADIDKAEFIERYYWKGGNELTPNILLDQPASPSSEDPVYSKYDYSEERMIQKERYIWIAENKRSRSKSPFSVRITIEDNAGCGDDTHIIIPSTSSDSKTNVVDVSVVTEIGDESESTVEIQEVIDNILDSKIPFNDTNENMDNIITDAIKTSTDESIEVMVLNLKDDNSKSRFEEPIFVITEASKEQQDCGITRSVSRDSIGPHTGNIIDAADDINIALEKHLTDDTKTKIHSEENEMETQIELTLLDNNEADKLNSQNSSSDKIKTTHTENTKQSPQLGQTQDAIKERNISQVNSDNSSVSNQQTTEDSNTETIDDLKDKNLPISVEILDDFVILEPEPSATIENQIQNEQIPHRNKSNVAAEAAASSSKPSDAPEDIKRNTKRRGSTKRRKSRKSIHGDNLEDLIQEGSLGPWFHK